MGGLVVNPDGHFGSAAIFDIALGIDFHSRGILKGVRGISALHTGVIAHVVEHLLTVGGVKRS